MAKVAEEVLAYCSSCKMDLIAVIVAMKGDMIVKVKCKTCKGERGFKAPKGVKDPGMNAVAAPKSPRAKKEAGEKADHSVGSEWRKVLLETDGAPLHVYSAKTYYGYHHHIKHPTFGLGVVMKHIHPNKMEVLFEMDLKTLICGLPPSGS